MHEQFAKLATKLITNNGRAMELVEVTNSGDEWNPTQTETLYDVIGVQTKMNYQESQAQGELVSSTDKIILIDSKVTPTVSMKVRDSGRDFEIVPPLGEVKPADTAILYRLRVRS